MTLSKLQLLLSLTCILCSVKGGGRVQPSPVQEIKAKNISSTKVHVTWIEDSFFALNFTIKYTAEGYNTSQVKYHIEDEDNYLSHFEETLENLHPYTKYTIQIRSHPQRKGGIWSEPRDITITTNQDVPAANPEILGFVLKPSSLENKRKVIVIWQSVPKLLQHGEIRQVRINVTDTNDEIQTYTVSGSPRNYTMEVEATESYNVTVEVSTVGYNYSLIPMPYQIPREKEMPPPPVEFRVISDRKGTITAYWNNKDVDQISLFWCKGVYSMEECHGELSKKTVPSGIQTVTLVQLEDYDQYIFGAAMEWVKGHQVKSGGIHWGDCTYQEEEDPAQPLNAKYSSYQEAGSLTIEWDRPGCRKYGYTENYYITCCLVTECNEIAIPKRTLKIPGNLYKYTISSLEGSKEYEVTMYAESPFGKRSKEVHFGHMKVVHKGLTGTNITLLCVGVIVAVLLLGLGTRCIYRSVKRWVKKFLEPEVEMPSPVELPELITSDRESSDWQDDTSLVQKPLNPQELSDIVSSPSGISDSGVQISMTDCDHVCVGRTYKLNYKVEISEDGAYSSLPCSESSVTPYTQYTSELEENDSRAELFYEFK